MTSAFLDHQFLYITAIMSPMLTIMLGVLLLSGWGLGFKTKMCDHDKIVEAVKKAVDCTLELQKDSFKKGENPFDGGINLDTYIKNTEKKYINDKVQKSLFSYF